jgi:hypothetical protein
MLESHDVVPSEVGAEGDEEGGNWRGRAEPPLLARLKTSLRNMEMNSSGKASHHSGMSNRSAAI